MKRAALFDRDGTLIVDTGYISDPDDVVLIPGARRLISCLKERGFAVCIVTNQSGIGRGMFTEADFRKVNRRVEELLGISFDAVEMCPHHPDDNCRCRKPLPFMLRRALKTCGCSEQGSFLAGDKRSDIEAGKRCGLKTFRYSPGSGGDCGQADDISDVTVRSLEEILEYV